MTSKEAGALEHQNETIVRTFLEAALVGDGRRASQLLAPDVVWHFAGRSSMAGDYRGPEGVAEFVQRMTRAMGENHRIDLHDMLANDAHTVVLWTRTAERGGASLRTNGVGVYHVRGGTIQEVWVVHEDQYAFDEFADAPRQG